MLEGLVPTEKNLKLNTRNVVMFIFALQKSDDLFKFRRGLLCMLKEAMIRCVHCSLLVVENQTVNFENAFLSFYSSFYILIIDHRIGEIHCILCCRFV